MYYIYTVNTVSSQRKARTLNMNIVTYTNTYVICFKNTHLGL